MIPASAKLAWSDWAMSVNGAELMTSSVTSIGVSTPASSRIRAARSGS